MFVVSLFVAIAMGNHSLSHQPCIYCLLLDLSRVQYICRWRGLNAEYSIQCLKLRYLCSSVKDTSFIKPVRSKSIIYCKFLV